MDWIEEFTTETDVGLSPERFRRWAALSVVATVTDRRVWTSTFSGIPLYPNLFVMLVGEPGTGKGQALRPARMVLETQEHVQLAPKSTSYESFINSLAGRSSQDEDGIERQRATMALYLPEWGTFLRRPDNDFMAMMADIYDNESYHHKVLTREDEANNLFVNILAACTPAWFAEGFPANAYAQGLPTRFQFIYDVALEDMPDFDFSPNVTDDPLDDVVTNKLFPLLDKISAARGFMKWSVGAGKKMNAWKNGGFEPEPKDPMLAGYCTRRHLHLAKLSIIIALSRHPERMIIEEADWDRAYEIMLEAEPHMITALSSAGGNEYKLRSDALYSFVCARWKQLGGKDGVPEWEVRQTLGRTIPPHMLRTVLEEMIAQQYLRVVGTGKAPMRKLKPGVRKK